MISKSAIDVALRCAMNPDCLCRDIPENRKCRPLALSAQETAALDSLRKQGPSSLSYGDFVAAVDFVLDPATLLEQEGDVRGLPEGPSSLNQYWLYRLRELPALQAWAAQNNDDHFQQKAMSSWWLWHQRALDAAASSVDDEDEVQDKRHRHLYAGLVMNAIASHYLEDFFAPGHVTTPREGLHDYAALSMHDLYNRKGASFELPPDRLLRASLLATIDPKLDFDLSGQVMETKGKERDIEDLRSTLAELGTLELIQLRGDGYLFPSEHKLKRNPSLDQDSRRQRVYMVAILARSILDVVRSYACHGPVNSFPGFSWRPLRRETGEKLKLPEGGLGTSGELGRYVERRERLQFGALTPLEFSLQTAPWESSESSRGVVSLVFIPTRWAKPPGRKVNGAYTTSVISPVLAFGVDYRVDEDLPGYGLFTRGTLVLPRLDANFGLGLGLERYSWRGRTSWRFRPELRAGVGLSFFMLFWGLGYDHVANHDGRLEGALIVRGGVAVSVPWSKFRLK